MNRKPFYKLAGVLAALMMIFCAQTAAYAADIYVSQATGVNSTTTAGTETNPFKSITYAMMVMASRSTPDPWVLHLKAGTYDADTLKAANERETFPITLRNGMTIQGDDGAATCIISGKFNTGSLTALIKGDTFTNITIKNLTLTLMTRTTGNGAAAELLKCAGVMQGCIISKNVNGYGAVYLTISTGNRFDVSGNTFSENGTSSYYTRGFYVASAFTGDLTGNVFKTNKGGFYAYGGFTGNVSGNTFTGNSSNQGLYVSGAFTGGITGNTFNGNSYGGLYVSGAFSGGDISGNIFSGNGGSSVSSGGGFYVIGAFTGDIVGNAFSGNIAGYGGGFDISGKVTGNISGNVFSRNSVTGTSVSYGGNVLLEYNGGENAIVSNNYFVHNTTAATLKGTGIFSDQNITVANNTFYNPTVEANKSAVNITSYAPNSSISNNIFANVHTPIWEQTALNLPIAGNDFSGATDILYRNNMPQGNDASYLEILLPGSFKNNKTWAPGIVGEGLHSGNWTAAPVYDSATNRTTMTDNTKNWASGSLKGMMLRLLPTASTFFHIPIIDNTANQITVMGNLGAASLGSPDPSSANDYSIDDYRLASNSQNIDTGEYLSYIGKDFEEHPRSSGAGFDIGADEYFTGVVQTTGYLQVSISPQAAITAGAQWMISGSGVWRNSGDKAELSPGSYTVEYKSITGYTTPSSALAAITLGQTSTLTGTYVAVASTYTVSGSVKTASGAAIYGVTMTLSTGVTGMTDSSGNYSFSSIAAGSSGTVTPSMSGYTFTPTSQSFSNISANQTLNFTGAPIPTSYTVFFQAGTGGTISPSGSQTVSGGGQTTPVTAAANSGYTFFNWKDEGGNIVSTSATLPAQTITANKVYTAYFQPQGIVYYTISGSVKTAAGAAIPGVILMPNTGSTATSDSSGNYSLTVASGWTGTVTPYRSGYTFTSSLSYSNVTSNKTNQNYIGTSQTPTSYTVSGSVKDTNSTGVSGVTLSLSNSGGTATSAGTGFYTATVSSGWSGTVTPSKTGCTFTPASQTFSSVTSNQSQNFTADCGVTSSWITRILPATYMPGVKVTVKITANPPSGTNMYSVEDKCMNGWTVNVADISTGGMLDSGTGKVKFTFQDGVARTMTYTVTPPSTETNDGTFNGIGFNNSASLVIGGPSVISKGLQTHPADIDGNFIMTGLEMNSYGSAWLSSTTWSLAPNPIPASYVSKAIWLWQHGESYKTDSASGAPPLCWVNTAGTRSERDNPSLTAVRTLPSQYTAGTAILVTITVSASANGYTVQEKLPDGWTASDPSDNGQAPSGTGTVMFFVPAPGGQAKILTYKATPPAGTTGSKKFSGNVSLNGADTAITGNASISDKAAGPGDLDNSGTVDLNDAIIALKIMAGIDVGTVPAGADVNGDHKIGMEEVIYILQKVAELRPSGT